MTSLAIVIARGLAASRPAAGDVPIGSVYYSTDTGALERNSGSAWESIAPTGAAPGGAAGGVLGGAYPNPDFAAGAAANLPFVPAGNLAATDVQGAIEELDTEKAAAADLTAHLGDAADAHDASAISFDNSGTGLAATDVQAAIEEVAAEASGGGSIAAAEGIFLAVAHRNSDSRLRVLYSLDGIDWTELPQPSVYDPPAGASVRDPSLLRWRGRWWIAHSANLGQFDLIVSDDLVSWSFVQSVDLGATYNSGWCWAPQWFVDDDGSVHVFVAADTDAGSSEDMQFKEVHPTTDDLTGSWSSPADVTISGGPAGVIDAFVVKKGGTYYLWYKNEVTGEKRIEYASASSLLGPYTPVGIGDWAGWGSGLEGESLVHLGGARWRIYTDKYTDLGIYYSDSDDDWATWTPKALVTTPWTIAHPHVVLTSDIAALRAILAVAGGGAVAAENIASGVIDPDRLATGTPDGTKYLRDDGVWAVPSGAGGGGLWESLYDSTLVSAAANFDVSGLPTSGYRDLIIAFDGARDSVAGTGNTFELRMRVNNDSGGNYDRQSSAGRQSGTQNANELGATSWLIGSLSSNGQPGHCEIVLPDYAGSLKKSFRAESHYQQGTANNDLIAALHTGGWRSTAAINRVTIFAGGSGQNFVAGSRLTIWGRKAS